MSSPLSPARRRGGDDAAAHANPSTTIRHTLDELEAMDARSAEYLNSLAFVLMRVADADLRICDRERQCMEEILVSHAELRPEHAVLVVEIARHRCRIADCGATYGISRRLRSETSPQHKAALGRFLLAVGDADGHLDRREGEVIAQIARELGCELPSDDACPGAC